MNLHNALETLPRDHTNETTVVFDTLEVGSFHFRLLLSGALIKKSTNLEILEIGPNPSRPRFPNEKCVLLIDEEGNYYLGFATAYTEPNTGGYLRLLW